MPDLNDLRAAFALLEQQIPDDYRSPVIQERLAGLQDPVGAPVIVLGPGRGRARGRRLAAAVAVAAAVVAPLAVVALVIALATLGGGRDKQGQVGHEPTTSRQPSSATQSPSTAPTQRSSVNPGVGAGMPADSSALISYVQGGTPVRETGYQRGASQQGQPMQATPGVTEFSTPSGNIACGMFGATGATGATGGAAGAGEVACTVARFSFSTPPKPASCQMNWGASWLSIQSGQVVRGLCLGGPPFAPISTVLPYGSTIAHGSLTCRSESAFLACADTSSGHGFAVDRATARIY